MSKSLSIIISDIELSDGVIVIKEAQLVDRETRDIIRKVDMNENFIDMIKSLEIDLTNYNKIQKMREKNPAFTKLCESFKCYL